MVAAVSGKRGKRYLNSSYWNWGSRRFAISPRSCIADRGNGSRMSIGCTRFCTVAGPDVLRQAMEEGLKKVYSSTAALSAISCNNGLVNKSSSTCHRAIHKRS